MFPRKRAGEKGRLTASTRLHIRRQVYLPLLFGLLVLAGFAIWLWPEDRSPSALADASFVCLTLPVMLFGLMILGLLVGCVYLVGRLIRGAPTPLRKLQRGMVRLERVAKNGSDAAVKPMMTSKAMWAGVRAFFGGIPSIFRQDEGSGHE